MLPSKTKRLLLNISDRINSIYPLNTQITSGSVGEGLPLEDSDIDMMYIHREILIYEKKPNLHTKGKSVFLIESEDTKPGFTKLL